MAPWASEFQYYAEKADASIGLLKASAPSAQNAGLHTNATIIGESAPMMALKRQLSMAAACDGNVLITGESGTGKELVAQAIHSEGKRSSAPFVAINCGSLSKNLIESELFGYEAGAFTGALRSGRPGLFECADNGTVFLDEVSEMPYETQANLLRVLQEKSVVRIGGHRQIRLRFRVVAATNKDLRREVEAGRFREDLYWRLNVIDMETPPLRCRTDDIPLLVEHFIDEFRRETGVGFTVEKAVYDTFAHYGWPGNIRELKNAIERASIYALDGRISVDHLPAQIREGLRGPRTRELSGLEKSIRESVIAALRMTEGNVSAAARQLGVARNTLYARMRRYQIDPADSVPLSRPL